MCFKKLFSFSILLGFGVFISNGQTIKVGILDTLKADIQLSIDSCSSITTTVKQVSDGNNAFLHRISACGENALFKLPKVQNGDTCFYAWSVYLPEDFDYRGHTVNILQFRGYDLPENVQLPCPGPAHRLSINEVGAVTYYLQHQGTGVDYKCNKINIIHVERLKGKWVDIVMNVKWTGNDDGFLNLGMRIGDEPYVQKISYKGATWWKNAKTGPYAEIGLSADPSLRENKKEIQVYTDQIFMQNAPITISAENKQ